MCVCGYVCACVRVRGPYNLVPPLPRFTLLFWFACGSVPHMLSPLRLEWVPVFRGLLGHRRKRRLQTPKELEVGVIG